MIQIQNLPPQLLSFRLKTKVWRKKHLDWADSKTFFMDGTIRKSVLNKRINYDLLNGKLHMEDMLLVMNPDSISASFVPENIQHYPIMNSKLNVLRGEESKRRFDFRVIVTNPNAISEIENNKKEALFAQLQLLIAETSLSEEDFNSEIEKLNDYFTYQWQDLIEIRANCLINHYVKELDLPIKFNAGFMDAMTVAEEIYQVDIVGGEPTVERLNPLKVRAFKSGFSNKFEDADIILVEDFWSPGRIIDTYYDVLSQEDMKKIEELPSNSGEDSMSNIDERRAFISKNEILDDGLIMDNFALFAGPIGNSNNYYDNSGNIKVLKVYWKSRRKIKRVKFYDQETGEEMHDYFPETYQIDKARGEEEKILWINEAWEGTKIGKDIYVNMRPRVVQYNRLSNPSRCHFGIIGSVYNLNDSRPFSLVDMMKSYNYMYDAVHDRLNKAIAANWGKLLRLDLAKIPKGWKPEQWMHYARVHKVMIENSFNEGNYGAATGKVAGALNNSSSGSVDAETGNYILQHVNLLEFIKMEMAEVAGISKQREGQVSNRETVGGIERATLLSSHITEWLFVIHDDVKKRVIECLLETAKVAIKGGSKKFQYLLSDYALKMIDIDGDAFSENDYGLLVDNSPATQDLAAKLDTLAQAALLNQTLSFSTIMKVYTNTSLSEVQRMIEKDERAIQERQAQAEQANREALLQSVQIQAEQQEADRLEKREANMRDNETKIIIEQMRQSASEDTSEDVDYSPENRERLLEEIRQFDAEFSLKKQQFELTKKEHSDDVILKKAALRKKPVSK